MPLRIAALAAVLSLPFACSGCKRAQPEELFVLELVPVAGDSPWQCGKAAGAPSYALADLRLFLHDLRTVDARGTEHPARLEPDGIWTTEDVALLDFVSATTACGDGRSGNARVAFRAPPGDVAGIKLTVGVPFAENHANPATARGPLAIGAMSWGWQAGYKFLKLEGTTDGQPMRVHLGETGCTGEFARITGCARSNRAEVTLLGALHPRVRILVDTVPLMSPAKDAPSRNCMGDPDITCAPALGALGLGAVTGRPETTNRVFSIGAS